MVSEVNYNHFSCATLETRMLSVQRLIAVSNNYSCSVL